MQDPYIERISSFLESEGIEIYRFIRRAKHRAVLVEHRGTPHTVIFPTSGSDWRGPLNSISDLRHELGLLNVKPSMPNAKRNRRRKHRSCQKPLPVKVNPRKYDTPRAATRDRYYDPLAILKARLLVKAETGKSTTLLAEGRAPVTSARAQKQQVYRLRTPWLGGRMRTVAL